MLLNTSVSRSTLLKVGLAFSFVAVIVVVVVVMVGQSKISEEDLLVFYEELIADKSQKALLYEFPTNASKYHPKNETVLDFGSYDFIIVGSGSAGAVIANRLSEVPHWKVLLLEAGSVADNLTEIPGLYVLSSFSDYNWGFKSVPQTTACLGVVDQKCVTPRGRGLGGTTLINDLMYSRGHPTDYSRWASLVNDSTWSYENVLHYFRKSENFHATDPEAPIDYGYHGVGGYWNVEHHQPNILLKYTFLEANSELGYNFTDYNGRHQMGGTVAQYNTVMGKRHDQATAFIFPVIDRDNLVVQTESYVTKIEINSTTNKATGVIFTYQNHTYRATATKEVVLSAGVISTPQILMLSGIGPQQHLEELGIPVVQNLSVGMTLREHTGLFGLRFSSNTTAPSLTLREQIEEYLNGSGPLTSNTRSHVIGWYKSNIEQTPDYPDLEMVIDVSGKSSALAQKYLNWKDETWNSVWKNRSASFYLALVLLRTHSVGTVKLKSNDPFDYPLIDYNLLSDAQNKDIDALYEGIHFCLKLVNTTAFRKIGAKFEGTHLPACSSYQFLSKDYWYCYLRQLGVAVFHPVGSCPMGTDPSEGAVVDSNLRVFGINNLRVADSSVFPFTLSSHTSADCAMIGEKVSDMIKLTY